nr:hypothetical protein GCM10025732_53730 [Glycomyces mayteni]
MASTTQSSGSSNKSTTVRAPWYIRSAFTAAERVAPGPAAKFLCEMWFRLPAGPDKRLRGPAPAGASVFELECLGTTVWGYDWGEGPLVYLVHGWGGSTGDFKFIAANLVAAGFRVVAFDAPSHGNSGAGPWGDRHANGMHLVDAMSTVHEKFGTPTGSWATPWAASAPSTGCSRAARTSPMSAWRCSPRSSAARRASATRSARSSRSARASWTAWRPWARPRRA